MLFDLATGAIAYRPQGQVVNLNEPAPSPPSLRAEAGKRQRITPRALSPRRQTGSIIPSVRYAITASLTLAVLASASIAVAAHGAVSPARSAAAFRSPSGNIECELFYNEATSDHGPRLTQAFCETGSPPNTGSPPRSVTMTASGHLRICSGMSCIGNPGVDVPVLAYGHRTTLGPFRCLSSRTGVRCRVRTGRGFLISRSGIEHL